MCIYNTSVSRNVFLCFNVFIKCIVLSKIRLKCERLVSEDLFLIKNVHEMCVK